MSEEMKIVVDVDDWTIGDHEDFEDIVGKPVNEAFESKRVAGDDGKAKDVVNGSAKAMKALVFICRRMSDPNFTLVDAAKIKISSLKFEKPENPSEPAA